MLFYFKRYGSAIVGLLIFSCAVGFSQKKATVFPFRDGEWLKYRIHYGFVNAGYATLDVKFEKKQEKPYYLFKGKGWTVGMFNWFFKTKDHYQSKVNPNTLYPFYAVRDVNEGGYVINRRLTFKNEAQKILVDDLKEKTKKVYEVKKATHDMISAFYYLRTFDCAELKKGESILLTLFFDGNPFEFKLKYLGDNILKTKFGKIKCHQFIPLVMSGRIFKEQESILFSVSADDNKIPIQIKAKLRVGSLKIDLAEYKKLANPMPIIIH